MAGYWPISFSLIYSHLHQTSLLYKGFIIRLTCSRLRDSGEKSFSKGNAKNAGGWGERPFPSCACLTFALLVSIRPHYTIGEPGTGYYTAKKRTFSCGTNGGNSERARWTHLAHSVSQSERTIRLSACGFIRRIKKVTVITITR